MVANEDEKKNPKKREKSVEILFFSSNDNIVDSPNHFIRQRDFITNVQAYRKAQMLLALPLAFSFYCTYIIFALCKQCSVFGLLVFAHDSVANAG